MIVALHCRHLASYITHNCAWSSGIDVKVEEDQGQSGIGSSLRLNCIQVKVEWDQNFEFTTTNFKSVHRSFQVHS